MAKNSQKWPKMAKKWRAKSLKSTWDLWTACDSASEN
jgi:hypothetical protein